MAAAVCGGSGGFGGGSGAGGGGDGSPAGHPEGQDGRDPQKQKILRREGRFSITTGSKRRGTSRRLKRREPISRL